jgi:hypothetical protein
MFMKKKHLTDKRGVSASSHKIQTGENAGVDKTNSRLGQTGDDDRKMKVLPRMSMKTKDRKN